MYIEEAFLLFKEKDLNLLTSLQFYVLTSLGYISRDLNPCGKPEMLYPSVRNRTSYINTL